MSDTALNHDQLLQIQAKAQKNRKILSVWLVIVLIAIFALVIVGRATRLTDSGLSIT